MNYNLEICMANIDDNIQNPSTEQVRNAIISLSEKGEFNDFIILATEHPVNNIEFIQCTPSGDSLYLVEAKVGSEQHQAFLYQKTVDKKELEEIFINYLVCATVDVHEWESPYEFYSEKELKNILTQHKLLGLKCANIPKENQIRLDGVNLYEFLNFATKNNVNSIFYVYYGLNENDYQLEKTITQDSVLSKIARKDIENYKTLINETDFSQDVHLVVFCLIQNSTILRHFETMESEIETAQQFSERIRNKYDPELQNEKERQKNERDIVLVRLKTILLTDSEFAYCTNQTLRREYITKFLSKEENKEFAEIFKDCSGRLNMWEVCNYVDYVYQILKKTKGKTNI